MVQSRARGVLLASLAVVSVSPDAMLLRYLQPMAGGGLWALLFWKSLAVGILNIGSSLLVGGGTAELRRGLQAWPMHVARASFFQMVLQLSFSASILLTDVAKALLLLSLNPLWAALFSRIFLHEQLPRRTVAALLGALASMALVFAPEALGASTSARSGGLGDLIALLAGGCLAAFLTCLRHSAHCGAPDSAASAAAALGCLAAAAVSGIVAVLGGHPLTHGLQLPWFALALLADGVCVAGCYAGMALAPRHITSAEVAMIMLLEVPLGPLWVFLAFGAVPAAWTLAGGALLLCTLGAHEAAGLCAGRSLEAELLEQDDDADRRYALHGGTL